MPRQRRSEFWIQWTGATCVGALAGGIIGALLGGVCDTTAATWLSPSALSIGAMLMAGAAGGGVAQWRLLRPALQRAGRWLIATAFGGAVGTAYAVGMVFVAAPMHGDSSAVVGVFWALALLGSLPLALWQQKTLPRTRSTRGWAAVTVASGVIGAVVAVISAMASHAAISPLLDHEDPWGGADIVLSIRLAAAVGVALGCAVVAVPTGVLVQRMLAEIAEGHAGGGRA